MNSIVLIRVYNKEGEFCNSLWHQRYGSYGESFSKQCPKREIIGCDSFDSMQFHLWGLTWKQPLHNPELNNPTPVSEEISNHILSFCITFCMAIWSILVHHVQCVSALTTARQQSTSWGRCRQSVVIKGSGSLSIPISTPAASHDTRSHSPIYHNFQTNWT